MFMNFASASEPCESRLRANLGSYFFLSELKSQSCISLSAVRRDKTWFLDVAEHNRFGWRSEKSVSPSPINNATEKLETREYYLFSCRLDGSIRGESAGEDVKKRNKRNINKFAGFWVINFSFVESRLTSWPGWRENMKKANRRREEVELMDDSGLTEFPTMCGASNHCILAAFCVLIIRGKAPRIEFKSH